MPGAATQVSLAAPDGAEGAGEREQQQLSIVRSQVKPAPAAVGLLLVEMIDDARAHEPKRRRFHSHSRA